ncbi:hypothetical protein [Nocardioides bizhenqiangii]|uniref:PknH-like extracellular domain-containing protein n=1 Tax=Nocardioides bizhenqiangii TaxID=3095076 RepID=A0ABZ0ZRC3_9ACTN|nr:hypothetical protein [Nocardioides sp. HM61]WQQ26893.1 hypothetical protein SHK19_01365 [Nocardioides sp. HM61]
MHSSPLSRRVLGAAVSLPLVVQSVACGGEGTDGADDPVTVVVTETAGTPTDTPASTTPLTEEQLNEAVLAHENLSPGWREVSSESEIGFGSVGCLAGMAQVPDDLFAAMARAEYDFEEDSLTTLLSAAGSVADEADATSFVDAAQATAAGCTSVNGTDDDGDQWEGTLTADETITNDAIDDQLLVEFDGTITTPDGTDLDIETRYLLARTGPHIAIVLSVNFPTYNYFDDAAYLQIAVDRFAAVATGAEPPVTVGPETN